MTVHVVKVSASNPAAGTLAQAVKLLRKGEVVVCPTDTGYAFAANALDNRAIMRVFHLKGRSFQNPIHIAVADIEAAEQYAEVTAAARYLAAKYLPGALTLVMKRKETISPTLVAGMDTVGVRIPDNTVILELLKLAGFPLTTTSANVSGQPGTYAVPEITGQLGEHAGEVALYLDQGAIRGREVSTIVDVSVTPAQLIRQGKISWLDLREELKRFDITDKVKGEAGEEGTPSP